MPDPGATTLAFGRKRIRPLILALALFAFADLLVLLVSTQYRSQFGAIGTGGDLVARVLPDVFYLVLYLLLAFRTPLSSKGLRVLRGQSAVLALMGLLMLVPWLGPVAALASPVAILYFGAWRLSEDGYLLSVAAAVLLAGINIWLFAIASHTLREKAS